MSLTIVLSGPQSQYQHALNTLRGAGYEPVLDRTGEHDHTARRYGLDHEPRTRDGKPARHAVCFVTVTGPDHNEAHRLVEPFGYRLRVHHETPAPKPAPTIEQKLAAIGLTRAELRAVMTEA